METSPFAVEDVYTELVIDVFYIFNSTVIDWTRFFIKRVWRSDWIHVGHGSVVGLGDHGNEHSDP